MPVRVDPSLDIAPSYADDVSRTLPTQPVPLADVQRRHDYPRYEVASTSPLTVASRPRARMYELG